MCLYFFLSWRCQTLCSHCQINPKSSCCNILSRRSTEKLNYKKLCLSSKLASIMWTKFKATAGMTMDLLAGRQREDVVIEGTARSLVLLSSREVDTALLKRWHQASGRRGVQLHVKYLPRKKRNLHYWHWAVVADFSAFQFTRDCALGWHLTLYNLSYSHTLTAYLQAHRQLESKSDRHLCFGVLKTPDTRQRIGQDFYLRTQTDSMTKSTTISYPNIDRIHQGI